jgi:hypothetical protein
MPEVMTTMDREYLLLMERDSHFLECLNDCGVDAWEGYSEASLMYEEECAQRSKLMYKEECDE